MTMLDIDNTISGLYEALEHLKGSEVISRDRAINRINDGIEALKEFKRYGMAALANIEAECGAAFKDGGTEEGS